MEEELYLNNNDELKIYRGEDFVVSDNIILHQATLGEICDFGEQGYFSLLSGITATPQSMKVQLWDMEIDYTEITPYELFYGMLYKMFPKEKTEIIFGDLDLTKFEVIKKDGDIALYQKRFRIDVYDNDGKFVKTFTNFLDASYFLECQPEDLIDMCIRKEIDFNEQYGLSFNPEEIIIDEYTYNVIVDYLCKSHMIERDLKMPMNNSTKEILIEDARDEMLANQNKKYKSRLKNLISTMVNSEGFKYDHTQVWNMKINAFMDSVKRISKIKTANLLLQSGYSGFGINLKDVNKKQLDWQGELE